MNELDKLRPEVRDALQVFDGEAVCTCHSAYTSRGLKDPQCNHDLQEWVDIIRAELLRLAESDTDLRGWINEAEQEAGRWQSRAERAETELAALKARIAQAPLQVVESLPGAVGPPWPGDHWIEVRMADPCACVGQGLIGKRVRLLVE